MTNMTTLHAYRCDLDQGTLEVTLDKPLMHQDAQADTFRVAVCRGMKPVPLAGMTVLGYVFYPAAGRTLSLTGTADGHCAQVTLPEAAYTLPGHASLVLQLQQGDVRHTVLKADFLLRRTGTDEPFIPQPTLSELLARIEAIEQGGAEAANPLSGKIVSFLGDSICQGADCPGGYGKIIAERNGMVWENLGVGGATVAAETYASDGAPLGWLCRLVDDMRADADYAVIQGGLNDAWRYAEGRETLGTITEGFDAALDESTFCGAFESMLKKLVTRFQGRRIGYIATPKTNCAYFDSDRRAPNLYHIALACCAKWGVPVCDLNTLSPSFALLRSLGTAYTADGAHPTREGYLRYYCGPIEAFLQALTTGGGAAGLAVQSAGDIAALRQDVAALQTGKLNKEGVSFRRALLTLADGSTVEIDVLTALDGTLVIPYTNRVPASVDTDGSVYNGVGYLTNHRLKADGTLKEEAFSAVTGFIPASAGDVIRIAGCGWYHPNAVNYVCAYRADFTFLGAVTSNGTVYGTKIHQSVDIQGLESTVTLGNAAEIAWIRVCASNDGAFDYDVALALGADMVVTVNEALR